MIEYVIALLVIVAYFAIVYVLKKKGILAKHHLTQGMVFLMWRTEGGKEGHRETVQIPRGSGWCMRRWPSGYASGVAIFMMSLLIVGSDTGVQDTGIPSTSDRR